MEGISNNRLLDKLEEIVCLEAEKKSQEKKYNLFLEADQPIEIVREIQVRINHLKVQLKAAQESLQKLIPRSAINFKRIA